MENRFELLSEADLESLSSKSESINTKRSTSTWLNVYRAWAEVRYKKADLENYPPRELDTILCQFYGEVRKKNGEEYESDSLRVMQSGLHRYLKDTNFPKSIIEDIEFTQSNKVLDGKARTLRQNGKGRRPNASRALTNEEEEILWSAGKLGRSNPTALRHTVWFMNTQHFGLRGRQEHTTMSMENFLFKTDENGENYVEFLEDPTKTRYQGLHHKPRVTSPKMFATGGERCPVGLLQFYISKRPKAMLNNGKFYLTPKPKVTNDGMVHLFSGWKKQNFIVHERASFRYRDINFAKETNKSQRTEDFSKEIKSGKYSRNLYY